MKTKTFNHTWIKKINEPNYREQRSGIFGYFIKLLIPVLTILAFSTLIIWALEISNISISHIKESKDGAREDIMVGPKLYTNNYKYKPVEIMASSAKKHEQNESIILLEQPNGNTFLTDENIINFSAKKGVYIENIGKINLSDQVHLRSTLGTNFFTEKISYDIDSGIFIGKNDISLVGPWGALYGKGFIFNTKSSIITIKGKPKLLLKKENDK